LTPLVNGRVIPSMRTSSFCLTAALAALAAGCGARTVADDYRDAAAPDGVSPPDRPPPNDQPPACPAGQTRCGGACVSTANDPAHCGACGVSCGPGGVCRGGTCTMVLCVAPFTNCNGACVDLSVDGNHCGRCGAACVAGQACVAGRCAFTPVCPAGQTNCNGACVDLSTDRGHCGACGVLCADGSACDAGRCLPQCPPGQALCGTECVSFDSNPVHCGRCGNRCSAGASCQAGACVTTPITGRTLRIESLLTSNCRVTEHERITGDDRGGIAYAGSRVFYTGDTATVAFDAESLTPLSVAPRRLDGIFGEVSIGLPFTLASNTAPLDERTSIVDALLQVSADGTPGRTAIPLGTTAFLDRSAAGVGIFAGALRAVVTQGARAWVIDGSSGLAAPRVTALAIPPIGAHVPCESWAFWGVAELFDGQQWVAYVRDANTIVRQNLATGAVETIASFPGVGLGDMCSFTVAPTRNRWYFHHEAPSFAAPMGGETLGYCDARVRAM
jgi:hypothetical protein